MQSTKKAHKVAGRQRFILHRETKWEKGKRKSKPAPFEKQSRWELRLVVWSSSQGIYVPDWAGGIQFKIGHWMSGQLATFQVSCLIPSPKHGDNGSEFALQSRGLWGVVP
jgi:hypothetical protein